MEHLTFEGQRISYVQQGEGPAVLLLHGFPLHSGMWSRQVAALAPRYRVLAPDLPGFGKSPPFQGAASMDRYAQVALAVLDHVEVPAAMVVGLSMGGYIAFALHARAPDRVAALALCDTRANADTDDGRKAREATARGVEEEGCQLLVERQLPNLVSGGASARLKQELERMILQSPPAGAAAALRAMAARPDSTPRLAQIACPALVVVGDHDALTPPEDARAMAARLPNATVRTIPAAGHLSNLEQPDAFNQALLEFLASASLPA